jgi:predicted enzyme related to lactoylglutathione lyase
VQPIEGMQMPYMVIKTAGGQNNGGMRAAVGAEPTYWLAYFGADDIDAAVRGADELGASTLVGATNIGMGNTAVLQDPQGAVFALFAGEFAD